MKKFLQFIAYAIRGAVYYVFYDFRYKSRIPKEVKNKGAEVTLSMEDISYTLHLHVGEGGLAEDLYLCEMREYPNVFYFKRYLEDHLRGLTTYVGIGSNIGYYALLARGIVKKHDAKTRIYALEPVRSTFHRLLHNLRLNKETGITALNVGIGDRDAFVDMAVMKQRNLSRIGKDTNGTPGEIERIEKIRLMTLGTLFEKHNIPKSNVLFRFDIEGYEYNLIVGNRALLRQLNNAHIIMEFHPFYLSIARSIHMLRSLKSAGFRLVQVVSCEPPYFVKMPRLIRSLLIRLFLFQYNADAIGKIDRLRTIEDLIREVRDKNNALYHYCNLHFYFSKS